MKANLKICVNLYLNKTYTQKCETASQSVGLEGIVALLDGYDASQLLRFCNTVKLI